MHATIKPAIVLAFAAALGIATAALAQEPTSPTATNVGPTPPAGPGFANINTPGPNGQCWKMTNSDLGYGYWGECATTPRAAARGRGHSAHARVEPTSPTATNMGPTPSANTAGPGFANVNTPGPNGQCWKMTNPDLGYGYWGECAAGARPAARRQARHQ
jgi:hypothetical protein